MIIDSPIKMSLLALLAIVLKVNAFFYDSSYIVLDDLPVNDPRLVRASIIDNKTANLNGTLENPFAGSNDSQSVWAEEAIKDIAYYLRSHKFNEFDRRYEIEPTKAPKNYHMQFPRPALRSLHWEVHQACDVSFLRCIEYLWRRIKNADLKRTDDTVIIMQEQHWKIPDNKTQITSVEENCKKYLERDNKLANPFQGPLERFQWRTTASYYMCWYTMNEVPDLRHLSESCNNFAQCLGGGNHDIRAKDDVPFACALYSFCPDPCCDLRHAERIEQCNTSPKNPCPSGYPTCTIPRSHNVHFRDAILNRWNVSCKCPNGGYEFNSRYGICVDIDECLTRNHTCQKDSGEACLNTKGYYKCVCKWGYIWDRKAGTCKQSEALTLIKLGNKVGDSNQTAITEKSYLRYFIKKIFRSKAHTTSFHITNRVLTVSLFVITFVNL